VQRNAVSLSDLLAGSWPQKPDGGAYFQILMPEGFQGRHQYLGTADAVLQHIHRADRFEHVLIVSGDHLYKVDFAQFYQFHLEHDADVSIMSIDVPLEDAKGFGVLETDSTGRIVSFVEKPDEPAQIPGNKGVAYASMGVYLFRTSVLRERLFADAANPQSAHDFGGDVIPQMIKDGARCYAYPFSENIVKGQTRPYWRDLGTLDSYHGAHMGLCGDNPDLNLYSDDWAIGTSQDRAPNAKVSNRSVLDHSLLTGGTIIDSSEIASSVIGRRCHINGSKLWDSILFDQIMTEPGCMIRRAIIDVDPELDPNERAVIPAGTQIGFDRELDLSRGFTVTESGITVVPASWFDQTGGIVTV
jgi:glucose-1-phosphate adenylyltransferase